jgi:hypothetical protein
VNELSDQQLLRDYAVGRRETAFAGHAVQCIGALAGSGNSEALDVLLNYEKYGFLLSDTVPALQPAAEMGNQKAIDALVSVTKDDHSRPLWLMAASGLAKPAESGNATAVNALIELSSCQDANVRGAVIAGLKGAAANQNARAAETLRTMGAP